jgi:hypothetical protein
MKEVSLFGYISESVSPEVLQILRTMCGVNVRWKQTGGAVARVPAFLQGSMLSKGR